MYKNWLSLVWSSFFEFHKYLNQLWMWFSPNLEKNWTELDHQTLEMSAKVSTELPTEMSTKLPIEMPIEMSAEVSTELPTVKFLWKCLFK